MFSPPIVLSSDSVVLYCVVLYCVVYRAGAVCSVNPCIVYRDWSSVFSPPIILPSDRDLQGTLEGQFEDLNDAGLDAHTS